MANKQIAIGWSRPVGVAAGSKEDLVQVKFTNRTNFSATGLSKYIEERTVRFVKPGGGFYEAPTGSSDSAIRGFIDIINTLSPSTIITADQYRVAFANLIQTMTVQGAYGLAEIATAKKRGQSKLLRKAAGPASGNIKRGVGVENLTISMDAKVKVISNIIKAKGKFFKDGDESQAGKSYKEMLLLGIRGILVEQAEDSFKNGRFGPTKWPKLKSERKSARRVSPVPLNLTGYLRNKMTSYGSYVMKRNPLSVVLNTSALPDYWAHHNFGTKSVPKRMFVGISPWTANALKHFAVSSAKEFFGGNLPIQNYTVGKGTSGPQIVR